jgi:hypothetical protein
MDQARYGVPFLDYGVMHLSDFLISLHRSQQLRRSSSIPGASRGRRCADGIPEAVDDPLGRLSQVCRQF